MIQACVAAHQALESSLVGLTDHVARRPSLLPDWSVGHVLTHLARNADALARMFEGAQQGEVAAMYVGGRQSRRGDIEAGAGRPANDLLADLHRASDRLDALFAGATAGDRVWRGRGATFGGEITIDDLPGRRRVEVEIHRVDLGLGYRFVDWPGDFLRSELTRMTGVWASRKPMGFDDLPEAALALAPADRFAWLVGRLVVDGLAPAGIF